MPRTEPKQKTKEKKAKSYAVKDYLIDIHKSSMLYGALVRSPVSKGKITNIDTSILPEEYILYTAREIPGNNTVKTFSDKTKIFATDNVNYKGEPVGILVGPDIKDTRKWASRIQISFDFSEADSGSDSGSGKDEKDGTILASRVIKKGFFEENENFKSSGEENVSRRQNDSEEKESPKEQDISENLKSSEEEFFKSFRYDFKNAWSYRETSPCWLETSGAFASTESGILNVYSPTKWPFQLEKCVSEVLSLPKEKIEIRKTQTQGKNTNGSWRSAILSTQAALASYLSGKPVKILLTHSEQNEFMKNGLETQIEVRTALDERGEIKAVKAKITADAGNQNPFAEEIADRLTVAFINMYSPEHIYVETKIIASRNPPTSFSAEKLDAASYFASESQIQHISRKTGILPDEIKSLNFQKSGALFKFKDLKWENAMNAISIQSDFKRKFSSYNLNSKQNADSEEHIFLSLPKRGIALSTGLEGAFFLGSSLENYQQKMSLTLEHDGILRITAPVPSASIADIWKNIASELLGIDQNMIQIDSDTESIIKSPLPENLSSNISIMTSLLKKCCLEIQKKRFNVPLPISSKKATSGAVKRPFSRESFSGVPFYSTAFGSAVLELEVNPYTFKVAVKGIWVAIDCGEIFSIKAAENTVRLAISQELSELIEDETLASESTNIAFVQSQNPPCQLGSLIHNLIPGAFAAALSQAIGATISSVPCTEKQIFECSETAEKEKKSASRRNEEKNISENQRERNADENGRTQGKTEENGKENADENSENQELLSPEIPGNADIKYFQEEIGEKEMKEISEKMEETE